MCIAGAQFELLLGVRVGSHVRGARYQLHGALHHAVGTHALVPRPADLPPRGEWVDGGD